MHFNNISIILIYYVTVPLCRDIIQLPSLLSYLHLCKRLTLAILILASFLEMFIYSLVIVKIHLVTTMLNVTQKYLYNQLEDRFVVQKEV